MFGVAEFGSGIKIQIKKENYLFIVKLDVRRFSGAFKYDLKMAKKYLYEKENIIS